VLALARAAAHCLRAQHRNSRYRIITYLQPGAAISLPRTSTAITGMLPLCLGHY